MNASIAQNES